jgi:hypothetical protein
MGSAAKEIQASRKRVLVRGTLFTPDGALNVLVRDVSPTGALISSKDRVPPRCDVVLKRGSIFVAGHVASSNDMGAEVEFYRSLSDDEVFAASLPLPTQA